MISALKVIAPLCAASRLKGFAQGFNNRPGAWQVDELATMAMWVLGVALVLVALIRVLSWIDALLDRQDPRRLFGHLCRAHRLGRRDRRLLRDLAAAAEAPAEAAIFVLPAEFDAPADAASRPVDIASRQRLRERLFSDLGDAERPAA